MSTDEGKVEAPQASKEGQAAGQGTDRRTFLQNVGAAAAGLVVGRSKGEAPETRRAAGSPAPGASQEAGEPRQMPRFADLPGPAQQGFRDMAAGKEPSDIVKEAATQGLSKAQVEDMVTALYPEADKKGAVRAALDDPSIKYQTASEQGDAEVFKGKEHDLQGFADRATTAMRESDPTIKKAKIDDILSQFQESFPGVGPHTLMSVAKGASIGIGIFALIMMMLFIIHSPKK